MDFDSTVLKVILVIAIINLVILYFFQSNCIQNNNTQNNKNTNLDTQNNNTQNKNEEEFTVGNQIMIPTNQNVKRIKTNNKGLKKGFHQHFKPNMPELGWRDYYIKHNNTLNAVCMLNKECNPNFKNIITRSYLDKLENVNNVYQNVNY